MKKTDVIAKIKEHVNNYLSQNQTINVSSETYNLAQRDLDIRNAIVTIYDFEFEREVTLPNIKGNIDVHAAKIGGNGCFNPYTFDIEMIDIVFDKDSNEITIGKINFLNVK